MKTTFALVTACALLGASEARLLTRRAGTPTSEKVIIGEGPDQYSFVGSEITFNQCYPYEKDKFGKIKVCSRHRREDLPPRPLRGLLALRGGGGPLHWRGC